VRRVTLTSGERDGLLEVVKHHAKAYVRERAAAIVKIADGTSAASVAARGLLVPRAPDTVYRWLDRYQQEGLRGLTIRPGRGRKPRLPPPERAEQEEQRDGLLELLGADPREHGQARTRWTLDGLGAVVPEFAGASRSGIWRILAKYKLRRKRGRDHIHSPDPLYLAKLSYLAVVTARVAAAGGAAVLLYGDEVTYYRQPSIGYGYAEAGRAAPRAERSTRSDSTTRVIGALDAASGRVIARQQAKLGVPALIRFFRDLAAAYPGRRIFLVLDNWPVHYHPDVLAALEPQMSPFPFFRPRSWPDQPGPTAKRLNLPIQLVPLPTYSPWLNPIEKLWRWLKQDVLHLHRSADNVPALRALVLDFLARFQDGSDDLLRYVGLQKHRTK
jgi:transposase